MSGVEGEASVDVLRAEVSQGFRVLILSEGVVATGWLEEAEWDSTGMQSGKRPLSAYQGAKQDEEPLQGISCRRAA